MKKSTKGAVAAGAAAVLLLGGAGSLAYWNATGTVPGGVFNSGELLITNQDCDPGAGTGSVWTLDGATAFNPATDLIVPGDTLTKICTFDVTATGTHLVADLTVAGATDANGNALETALAPSGSFTVGGATVTSINSADHNGDVLEATVVVSFPEGASPDNTTQDLAATLTNFVVTATQNHS